MAGELIVVDNSIVIAGGTTTANLPAEVKKARRSVPSFELISCSVIRSSPIRVIPRHTGEKELIEYCEVPLKYEM
jgi:hypothetical protein